MIKSLMLMGGIPLLALLAVVWAYMSLTWYSITIAAVLVVATVFEGYLLANSSVQ